MRSVICSILILLVLLLSGCDKNELDMANVRFKNIMTDHYVFPYGLMFGDALYGDSLKNSEITPYLETNPGPYSILARRVGGDWIEISEQKFNVLPGLSYTILIFGTVDRFAFQFQVD